MRILSRLILVVVAVIVIAGAAFWAFAHKSALPDQAQKQDFSPQQIAAGRRVATAGNCVACHTPPNGQAYAGGLAIDTGFGVIYSTNITPDPQTGIGHWSLAAFTRALREGVAAHGTQLYPAFPFDHYTHMTDADIGDLYAFIMTRDPVNARPPRTQLRFPYSMRPLLAGWRLLYLHQGGVPNDPQKGADWNRGAYLVEALGHCGSCHTPRNSLGAEIASKPLAGGVTGDWWAPPLDASTPALLPWKPENVFNYLRRWDADHGGPHGPMAEVAASMRRLPEQDVRAIAAYISDRMSGAPDRSKDAAEIAKRDVDVGSDQHLANGKAIFDGACARCHESGGDIPFTTRLLSQHTIVQGPDPRNVINVVLNGIPQPEGQIGGIMPAFRLLDDHQIADLLAYVRKRYTNQPPWPDVQTRAAELRNKPQVSETRTTVAQGASQ